MSATLRTATTLLLLLGLAPALRADSIPALEPTLALRQQRLEHVDEVLRQAKVLDAKRQVFESMPWARADVRTLALLDQALAAPTLEARVDGIGQFLEAARREGEDSFVLELDRLRSKERWALARTLGCDQAEVRSCLIATYREYGRALMRDELALVAELDDDAAVRSWARETRESLRRSVKVKGRTLRRALTLPARPAVSAWRRKHTRNEYEGPQPIDFAHYRVYRPLRAAGDSATRELLERFAPIVVQETLPDADYPGEDDRIGAMVLEASRKGPRPTVVTDQPTSYAYADTLLRDGQEYTQLVYTYWYPEHPKLKRPIDPGAGKIEGITLRLTLDRQGAPRLFETIYSCGCSHRVFVDRQLEEAAASQFGGPEGDRPYAIQRDLEDKIDWIVPELVDVRPDRRPIFFVRAGHHFPAAIRFEVPETVDLTGAESYEVRPYTELERAPFGNGYASVFDERGLVIGANRPWEEALLTPLGILRAGHPRQRGTQLIHFDQADFDDPELFDRYLRLPSSF